MTPDPARRAAVDGLPVGGGRASAAEGPLLVRPPRPAEPEPEWEAAARRVVEHRAGPLRVIGGPGTGKTTVLLEGVARRVRAGVDPGRILFLVGSRRAAADLRERLVRRIHPDDAAATAIQARTSREMLVRTVHSYAFGIMRLHAARAGDPPPRLLAGAEQDAVVRDLLAGEIANWNGSVPGSGWPERLRPALGIPAFAAELRELLLRAEERGLGPEELLGLGERHGVPEWAAAGRFFRTYEQVILLRGAAGGAAPQATAPALDSAELVAAALDALAFDPELLHTERERVRHLLVDDAQDLDPQQLELVRVLARTATSTLIAGDPDQAVLGFRGADPDGLRAVDAPTAVLTVDHRQRDAVRAAGARLASRLSGSGEGRLRVAPASLSHEVPDPGSVLVRTFSSAATEAAWIADRLRRAHLVEGVPWSEMAVLSRSARRTLPALRRALVAAGVPIAAPPEELPLARQPAVLPFLLILRAATRPEEIDADAATALLTSALGSGDPMRMRRLRRGLLRLHAAGEEGRRRHAADLAAPAALPASLALPASPAPFADSAPFADPAPPAGPTLVPASESAPSPDPHDLSAEEVERVGSDPLLVEALRAAAAGRPDPLTALPPGDSAPLRAVSTLLATAAEAAGEGRTVEEVLWRVWQRSGLARRWAAASARGGPVGAAADRDLDAVLALFDAAARYTDRLPGADVAGFAEYLGDQHLPGDTQTTGAPREDAVALLTAHAARGREWEVVAVPGVQEGSWPDLRLRGSLLGSERLVDVVAGVAEPTGAEAVVSRVAPLLAEERRLFYVACTRARRTLLVSAVHAEDEQPSRFLDELDPLPADATEGRPTFRPGRALVLAELVGELRRAVTEPDHGDPARAARRRRAAAQLARLAAEKVPGAHPDDWYGLPEPSAEAPLRPEGEIVPVSPSDIERILSCPLRWVLERHGGNETGALSAVTGSLVHALVQAQAAGAEPAELDAALRTAWARLDAGAPWFGRRELARVRGMLAGYAQWLRESREQGLRLVAVEHPVQLDIEGDDPDAVEVGTPRPTVRLRGRVDRLEVDAEGRPVVVDVKTGRTAVSAASAAEHPQLAVYQLAATLGAFSDLVGEGTRPGGARLVFVADRKATGSPKEPVQPPLDADAAGQWRDVVWEAARQTSGPAYVARVGPDCDRCPVRGSCPAVESGRSVVEE
ncbi:ATP-dependent helicase [Pseudonocardia halophobica]|uniref:ATP-dependent helicase n=1 Tax=Pseudonocardia halophobica TaxID=29401 RepID=UPI003D8E54DE